MKLKDIADMKDYLETRCYCPYEIYDTSGFFYELFYPDTECTLLISGSMGKIHGAFVVAKPERTGDYKPKEQIIYIEITDNMVDDCVRIDNTQNNRGQIQKYKSGEIDHIVIDEYPETNTQGELEKILISTDFVCVS